MRLFSHFAAIGTCLHLCAAQPTAGIEALVQRRLPDHADKFSFSLTGAPSSLTATNITSSPNDEYTVSSGNNGTLHVSGNSPIALASGLRWYLTTYLHVDIYWHIGPNFYLAPKDLPKVNSTYHGSSIVPWRYHFNTVTFSYTTAFWTWDDWELQLDWMALRGINLPLAWVGYEKILVDVFLDFGFTEADIASFLSGPAFQAWNRFGNIQGSWGGHKLPMSWLNGQSALQKKIVARMVEIGMTPVLPCFTGYVPIGIDQIYPNAAFVRGSEWAAFPLKNTNVTFLEPFDPLFAKMQKSFISKQAEAYGDVSRIYTLDQYNENDPFSGDLDYLRNVTNNTIKAMKAADPNAVWMLQGWLFYSSPDFWTNERVEAYLGGVGDSDMLILDLFSESHPQWSRTNSYYGKPWIWCQLHDYGENMGLYGQVQNVTDNPVEALGKSNTMVGIGLTMEGQEGNEVIYDILLDQAWSKTPLDSQKYFMNWVSSRYHGPSLPNGLYEAWDTMRTTVYNNTNLDLADSVTKSIFELLPNTTGLLDITGSHSTGITYDPADLVGAWQEFYAASMSQSALWDNAAYVYDLTDVTRQVMANAFNPLYSTFVNAANHSLDSYSMSTAAETGQQMIELLYDLDSLLTATGLDHFNLPPWIASARAWATPTTALNVSTNASSPEEVSDYYEYTARNQITLWGPTGQINSYASKQWGGLISSYDIPRWRLFVEYTMNSTTASDGENSQLFESTLAFEEAWQEQTWGEALDESYEQSTAGRLRMAIAQIVQKWPAVFGM